MKEISVELSSLRIEDRTSDSDRWKVKTATVHKRKTNKLVIKISNKKAIWKINVSNLEFGNMHRHCRAYQSALLKIYHEQLQTTVLLLAE